jgi:ABC-type metal ion transport system substrate-binding protein
MAAAGIWRGPARRQVLAALAGSLWPAGGATAGTRQALGAQRGPQADLLAYAATLKPAASLRIELTVADDPAALAEGLVRGTWQGVAGFNSQELAAWNQAHAASLQVGFPTVTLPIGIYAQQRHSIVQLRTGDRIVLPAPKLLYDRARILLYNYGLLYAHEDDGLDPDLGNIVNPRGFVLQTAPLAELPARLHDAAAVLIPYGVAVDAGLKPAVTSIGLEDGKSPYSQVLAVRAADRAQPWLATLARIFQSREVRRYIYDHYGDSVQPPW